MQVGNVLIVVRLIFHWGTSSVKGKYDKFLEKTKQEEAKNEASSRAQNEWQQNALDIIFNPQENPQNMRSDLFFQNTNCTKCGKKPKWDKGMGYMTILPLSLMPAIISGIVAIAMKTSWNYLVDFCRLF